MGNVSPPPGSPREHNCSSEGCRRIDYPIHSHIGNIGIGTWNVEGLTDIKVEQIIDYMTQNSIGVLCMQETRRLKSDVFMTSRGYKVILSGSSTSEREWAGVGFILSPKVCKSIAGFCQYNNRLASVKLKTGGGVFAVLSAYAPHNMKEISEKIVFYDGLNILLKRTSTNGPRLIYGDFNARLGHKRQGEDSILGEHGFGRESTA